jgi:hypothetical protein
MSKMKCPFWAHADSTDKYKVLNGCPYMRNGQCIEIEVSPGKDDSFCGRAINDHLGQKGLLLANRKFAENMLKRAEKKFAKMTGRKTHV